MTAKCEKCSMDGTFFKEEGGVMRYFCDHHAPGGATRIGGSVPMKSEQGFKKFIPLIVIFSVIFLFTIVTSILRDPFSLEFAMRMMMGSFFAIFGLFKVFNLRSFVDAYMTYDIVAMRSRTYAFIYPFLEILLAVLYLINLGGLYRDVFTFILMTVSTIGVVIKIRQKEEVPCACLGMVFKIPMTRVTLTEDIVMASEALLMIILRII